MKIITLHEYHLNFMAHKKMKFFLTASNLEFPNIFFATQKKTFN